MQVSVDDVRKARARIADGVLLSPCPESIPLSELTKSWAHCKLECLQRTGSFKDRGARNALLLLGDAERRAGVIAASAGNHALGLAYQGNLLNIPVTVVMPTTAPLIKVESCRRLKARVILHGESFLDAKTRALEILKNEKLNYIHGYDDPAIIAGQGTIALEILEQVPEVDVIIAPVGGGGLIAGIAAAISGAKRKITLIGVVSDHAGCFAEACRVGHPVPAHNGHTLADGLAVPQAGDLAFAVARPHISRMVTVSESELALAILRLVELEKIVVEGAGAAPVAAALSGRIDDLIAGKRVVFILSGGNIDPMILSSVIEKGLVADGRLSRFTAVISDRPGGLARFAALIGECGASIRDIFHDRAFAGPDVLAVNVFCVVETRDHEHVAELHSLLRKNGIRITPQRADNGAPVAEKTLAV
jgi:threonine dehydratase